ncbi:MAG: class I SAM-dependent methyltransferase [Leptolyngbyaceae cyanobacterium]
MLRELILTRFNLVILGKFMQEPMWAEPRDIHSLDDCYFYHTMDIPTYGIVHGDWDLRGREAIYFGDTNFQGKRVLEIGTASGHLCFSMEKLGAEVVAYDLSDQQQWDIVPYAKSDYKQRIIERKKHINQLNNSFWLAHKAYNSHAKVMYGTVYDIPDDIGQFDICTFGSILLHLRDPFLALQRAASHATETVIVTDLSPKVRGRMLSMIELITGTRLIRFLPNAQKLGPTESWWSLSPKLVSEFLQILGFANTRIFIHRQKFRGREIRLYTVVGQKG